MFKKHKHITSLLTVLLYCKIYVGIGFAQEIKKTESPKFEETIPVNYAQFYTNSNLTSQGRPTFNYINNIPMGGNAQDILHQPNIRAAQIMGAPNNSSNNPDQNQKMNERYINERIKNDPMYQMPNNTNRFNQPSNIKDKEMLAILNEIHAEEANNNRKFNLNYYKSPEFLSKSKPYNDALNYFEGVFSGKSPLSISTAYFVIENAYGNTYLNEKEYTEILNNSVGFIQKWMRQNGYSLKDNAAIHLAIQKFMSDTLTITTTNPETKTAKNVTHYPFSYDYEDYQGEKDYRNYFTTKCLATGSGQCNSLPAMYASIAQKLGAKVYLSFAPHHSFIKYYDNKGNIHNYEPTSNWKISDKWYQDNMFISPEAKRTGIYLDTLNTKQIVANCVLDLAAGYIQKHGAADGVFVRECLKLAQPYFPKRNNLQIYFVKSALLARELNRKLIVNNLQDLKEISQIPEAEKIYQELIKNEEIITSLGYQEQPQELYESIMKQHEFKEVEQKRKYNSLKEKRNLFQYTF